MADLKYKPVRHDHREFLAKAMPREGPAKAYKGQAPEYRLAAE